MSLTNQEFQSIRQFVEGLVLELSGRRGSPFFVAKVTKNDPDNNLIWVKEIGDFPIPLFGFTYEVKYHDESPRGAGVGWGAYKTYVKTAESKIKCPEVGQPVLIVREMGANRLPRCVGVLQSTNFAYDEESEA